MTLKFCSQELIQRSSTISVAQLAAPSLPVTTIAATTTVTPVASSQFVTVGTAVPASSVSIPPLSTTPVPVTSEQPANQVSCAL